MYLYCKPTNLSQYTNYTSFFPWCYKNAWITNIIHRATVIYDETKIQAELNRTKKFIAWNGFAKWIDRTLIAKKLKNIKTANNKNQLINENNGNVDIVWINLPYLGRQGDHLLLSLNRKVTRCLTKKSKIQSNAVNTKSFVNTQI